MDSKIFYDFYYDRFTAEQRKQFEDRLKTDVPFRKAFRQFQINLKKKQLHDMDKIGQRVEAKAEIQEILQPQQIPQTAREATVVPISRARRFSRMRVLAAAAAMVGVFLVGYLLLKDDFSISPGQQSQISSTYEANKNNKIGEVRDNFPSGMSKTNNVNTRLNDGIEDNQQNRHSQAIKAFNSVIDTLPSDKKQKEIAYYFRGDSYRGLVQGGENDKLEKAISDFKMIDDSSNFYELSRLGLFLLIYENKGKAEAEKYLNKIMQAPDSALKQELEKILTSDK